MPDDGTRVRVLLEISRSNHPERSVDREILLDILKHGFDHQEEHDRHGGYEMAVLDYTAIPAHERDDFPRPMEAP